jgi:hypothetical protein
MGAARSIKKQAYLLSPWRNQTQLVGSFLLVVVVAALVAFIYLNTTAQAATIGRQIQDMQIRMDAHSATTKVDSDELKEGLSIEELSIRIADLEAQLAGLTAQTFIEAKAREMDMQPHDPEQVIYLYVPGYQGRAAVRMAPPPRLERANTPVVPAIYKQSLVDWLKIQIVQSSRLFMEEVKP